jgi:hypothetical protein
MNPLQSIGMLAEKPFEPFTGPVCCLKSTDRYQCCGGQRSHCNEN